MLDIDTLSSRCNMSKPQNKQSDKARLEVKRAHANDQLQRLGAIMHYRFSVCRSPVDASPLHFSPKLRNIS